MTDKLVIAIVEGVSSTLPIRVAAASIQLRKPQKLVLATPVCPKDAADLLRPGPEIDELIALREPIGFAALSDWYLSVTLPPQETILSMLNQDRQ